MGYKPLAEVRRAIQLFYGLTALLVIGVTAWGIFEEHEDRLNEARRQAQTIVRALDEHATHTLDTTARYLLDMRTAIESQGGVRQADLGMIEEMVRAKRLHGDGIRRSTIVDAAGVKRAATVMMGQFNDVAQREYFARHRDSPDRNPLLTAPFIARVDNQPVIPLTVRIDRRDGSFDGVALATLDVNYFLDFYRSLKLEHDGTVALVAPDGRFLLRYPARADTLLRSIAPDRIALWDPAVGDTMAISPIDRTERLVSYRHLTSYPAYILVTFSRERVLEAWRRESAFMAAFAIAVLAVFGWIARFALQLVDREQAMLLHLQRNESEIRTLNATLEERVRARTAELAATNAELESFSYSVSHDLRAPLRHLIGYAAMLRRDEEARGESMPLLAKIEERAGYMNSLIDELLQLSRITRAEITRSRLDLSTMAKEEVDGLRSDNPERNVSVQVAPDLKAEGDPVLIRSLLENLIGNAWKYSSRTPNARIEIGLGIEDGEKAFYVRDNGVGFDPKYASKLFGVFQRLHSQADFQGTGVGLATARRVVTRHGGRIWAHSTPGEGATFFFTLPEEVAEGA